MRSLFLVLAKEKSPEMWSGRVCCRLIRCSANNVVSVQHPIQPMEGFQTAKKRSLKNMWNKILQLGENLVN